MPKQLRVLIVEDSPDDTTLLVRELRKGGYEPAFERVETAAAMAAAFDRERWDLVISDFTMPQFNGLAALRLLQERELDVPFIVVSGKVGEDVAVQCMKAGASDYMMKGRLARLVPAIERELREAELRQSRKAAMEELRHREEQLLRAQRLESIGTLSGGIAHDLNNVLTPIMMAVSMLKDDLPSDDRKALVDEVLTSVKRGAEMVRQILSFSRGLEGQRIELQLKHIIRDTERLLQHSISKAIAIETAVDRDLWCVSADATQISQVLMNLCVNARDAMPQGGKLTITAKNVVLDAMYARVHQEAKPGPYVLLEVQDTGTGIPPEIQGRIFDPFFTTKEHEAGTGLGLSTVLGIVKSHGGFVTVYSEPGRGSRFLVHLPASEAATVPAVTQELPQVRAGNGELVLVVDDEAAIREITRAMLESYGYKVIAAADGQEAITCYTNHRQAIRLVLLDMMMPVMDGPATIRVIRGQDPDVPIVLVGGLLTADKESQAAELGARTFLQKPYTSHELLRTVGATLQPGQR